MPEKPFFIDDWRKDSTLVNGDLNPKLFYEPCSLSRLASRDLLVCAADKPFFNKYFDMYIGNSAPEISLHTAIFVFCSQPSNQNIKALQRINGKTLKAGIGVFGCTQERLANILACLPRQARSEYRINYIKSLRYYFAREILLRKMASSETDSNFVICGDLDIVLRGDLSSALRKLAPGKEVIATYNSRGKPSRQAFTKNMCCTYRVQDPRNGVESAEIDCPFLILKGGLAGRATAAYIEILDRIILYLYCDDSSAIFTRLFTYYYGDQIAVYLALRDYISAMSASGVSTSCAYLKWIDYATSSIANLDEASKSLVHVLKGQGAYEAKQVGKS